MFFTPGEFLNVVKGKEVPWRILVDKNTNAVKLWNLKNPSSNQALPPIQLCPRAL